MQRQRKRLSSLFLTSLSRSVVQFTDRYVTFCTLLTVTGDMAVKLSIRRNRKEQQSEWWSRWALDYLLTVWVVPTGYANHNTQTQQALSLLCRSTGTTFSLPGQPWAREIKPNEENKFCCYKTASVRHSKRYYRLCLISIHPPSAVQQ